METFHSVAEESVVTCLRYGILLSQVVFAHWASMTQESTRFCFKVYTH